MQANAVVQVMCKMNGFTWNHIIPVETLCEVQVFQTGPEPNDISNTVTYQVLPLSWINWLYYGSEPDCPTMVKLVHIVNSSRGLGICITEISSVRAVVHVKFECCMVRQESCWQTIPEWLLTGSIPGSVDNPGWSYNPCLKASIQPHGLGAEKPQVWANSLAGELPGASGTAQMTWLEALVGFLGKKLCPLFWTACWLVSRFTLSPF